MPVRSADVSRNRLTTKFPALVTMVDSFHSMSLRCNMHLPFLALYTVVHISKWLCGSLHTMMWNRRGSRNFEGARIRKMDITCGPKVLKERGVRVCTRGGSRGPALGSLAGSRGGAPVVVQEAKPPKALSILHIKSAEIGSSYSVKKI